MTVNEFLAKCGPGEENEWIAFFQQEDLEGGAWQRAALIAHSIYTLARLRGTNKVPPKNLKITQFLPKRKKAKPRQTAEDQIAMLKALSNSK